MRNSAMRRTLLVVRYHQHKSRVSHIYGSTVGTHAWYRKGRMQLYTVLVEDRRPQLELRTHYE